MRGAACCRKIVRRSENYVARRGAGNYSACIVVVEAKVCGFQFVSEAGVQDLINAVADLARKVCEGELACAVSCLSALLH